jgi:hypothetical protein
MSRWLDGILSEFGTKPTIIDRAPNLKQQIGAAP